MTTARFKTGPANCPAVRLPALLVLPLLAASASAGPVEVFGEAQGTLLAVAVFGHANCTQGGCVAVSALGPATSQGGVAAAAEDGRCRGTCQLTASAFGDAGRGQLAASGSGGAWGDVAVSGAGSANDATLAALAPLGPAGCGAPREACTAASVTGDASGGRAVSVFGHADGDVAFSGCDDAGLCLP